MTKNLKERRRARHRRKKLKESGWKLRYPRLFKLVDEFPYIVRGGDGDRDRG